MITRHQSRTTLYVTILLVLVVGLYGLFQARHLIAGPSIVLETPHDGSTLNESLVTIRGTAHNTAGVALNGRTILTDTKGHFSEELLLSEGYNIIVIEARDQFGKRTEETVEVMYKKVPAPVRATQVDTSNGS